MTYQQTVNNTYRISFWMIFTLFISFFAFIYAEFPYCLDDWTYIGETLYSGLEREHHSLFDGIKECLNVHYNIDTARIGNTIGAIMLVFVPNWLTILLIVACFTLGFYYMSRLSNTDYSPAKLILLCFLTLFCINWQEHLFSIMFAFNYIVVIPLYLGVFIIFFNHKRINYIALVILGIILGAWHESFTLSFLSTSFVLFITKPVTRTRHNFALFFSVIVGFIWILAWPAMWTRASERSFSVEELYRAMYTLPWLIAVFLIFIHPKRYGFWKDSLSVALLATGIVLIPIMLYTTHIRAIVPCYILSCCVICKVVTTLFPKLFLYKNPASIAVSLLLGVLTFGHLIAVSHETVIFRNVVDRIIENGISHKHSGGDFFTPVRYPWQAHWAALNRPDQDALIPGWISNRDLKIYIDDFSYDNIIPIELKSYAEGKGELLGGNAGYRMYNTYIVSENPSDTIDRWMEIGYNRLNEANMTIHTSFTGEDGRKYVYILPMRSKKSMFFGEPVAVSDLPLP